MAGKRGKNSKLSTDTKQQSVDSAQREYGTRRSSRNKNNEAGKSPIVSTSKTVKDTKDKSPASRLFIKNSESQSPSKNKDQPSSSKKDKTTNGSSSTLRNNSPSKSVKNPIGSPEVGNIRRKINTNDKSSPAEHKKQDKHSKVANNSPKKNQNDVSPTRVDASMAKKKKVVKTEKKDYALSSHLRVNVHNLDIGSLLALGENRKQNHENTNQNLTEEEEEELSDNSDFVDASGSESEDEWEEVSAENQNEMHNLENKLSQDEEYKMPEEGIQITLSKDGVTRKKGKKGFDIEGYIRREMNRNTKELYVDLHKVSLLCLIARGRMINNYLNSESNLAAGFSLLPTKQSCPPKYIEVSYIERFINWFRGAIKLNRSVLKTFTEDKSENVKSKFENELAFQLEKKQGKDMDTLVFMFILILRSCGVQVRLVWSLQPIPLRPSSDKLLRKPQEPEENEEDCNLDNELPCSSKSTKNAKPAAKKETKNTKAAKNKKEKLKTRDKGAKKSEDKPKGRKMISSSEDEDETPSDNKNNMWPEVYLEEEERWVSVDLVDGKFMCDSGLEAKATKKISYIVSFDNNNNIKDVTRRYDSHWLTGTQKLRVTDWWNETLKAFRGKRNARDKMEDSFLDEHLMSQPFPKSIQEFKGHPLYSLRRHLLKFEAIYPPAPPPLGFIKNEPVYARECVKTLHSRELWLKQAKVVRMGEDPYKIVKSRPKYERGSGQLLASQPLDLFGEWQVEDYVPPTAENGIVPRNEYGNVELFLDKMLPKGTVHLQLAGLNRVAKKLGIDCAPALTGFEFHCGGSHPTYDGFVVCEEFKEVLLDAWSEEQKEQEKKEREKRLKRIYDNWTKLLKGLLIREKLNRKYAFNLGGKRKNLETDGDSNTDATEPKAGPSEKRRKR